MGAIGNPIAVALEYIEARNTAIERHKGSSGIFFDNANRTTQLQFVEMCNRYAARFANEMPMWWNEPEWERFSVFDIRAMQQDLDDYNTGLRIDNQATWEAMSELSKTYLALLRLRMTP